MCFLIGTQTGGVVSTYLVTTGSIRSRTVKLTDDNVRISRETSLKIRPDGSYEYHKHIFVGRMYTYLCTCTDKQRADIKRSAAFVWRNETLIGFHHLLHCCKKSLCRQFRHQYTVTCTLQTLCIGFRTENTDFTVLTAIRFQSFKSFLSIMQTSGCHVNVQCFFRTKFQFSPCTVAIVTTYIIICLHITEGQIRPINLFHCVCF